MTSPSPVPGFGLGHKPVYHSEDLDPSGQPREYGPVPPPIKRRAAWIVIIALVGILAVGLFLLTSGGGTEPVFGEADLLAIGLDVESRTESEGKFGLMIELVGQFNNKPAAAVVHIGSERGWRGVSAPARIRIYEIRDAFPRSSGLVNSVENVWLACPEHLTCIDLNAALKAHPVVVD